MITEAQIRAMMPNAGARLTPHLPFIGPALSEGHIDTPRRIAAWMAQAGHESGEYRWMSEIWGPTDAQLGYEGRADLGNVHPGDGYKFRGRCPFQITGYDAYLRCGTALGLDLIRDPDQLMDPKHATRGAVWFWNDKVGGLSPIADRDWFRLLTRLINGGYNGLEDRVVHWRRNREILGLPPVDLDKELGAIMDFQRAHGLESDGVVGAKTLAALKAATTARAA